MAALAQMRATLAAGALLVALAAACGAEPEPAPPPTATATPVPPSSQPATAGETPVAEDTPRWRTDLKAGGRAGNAAPNVTVTLLDGTKATLEEIAGGKPLLLYFFATW